MGIKTLEEALKAVRQDGRVLMFMPRKLRTEEVCLEAVRQTGRALALVPMRLGTREMCLEAVQRRGFSLVDVPVPLRSVHLCIVAVRQNHGALLAVPMRHRAAVHAVVKPEAEAQADTFRPGGRRLRRRRRSGLGSLTPSRTPSGKTSEIADGAQVRDARHAAQGAEEDHGASSWRMRG